MKRSVPTGDGLVARRLRIADAEVVCLGGILAGYDHLASLHGDGERDVITLLTPATRALELDALLRDLAAELTFEIVP